jgi:hypoxanthine phosphoribosyltransferase
VTINDEPDLNNEASGISKHYISAEELLQDSFLLAKKIFDFGYHPDHIIGIWRGGSPIAIAIHEYLDYMGIESEHHPVKISSYSDLGQQKNHIVIKGL